MAYGFTYTLPAVTGTHTDFPVLLATDDFPPAAIDGTANAIDNGGGNLRAYTSDDKTTQLPVEVVRFVSGGSPSAEVWVKIPTAATSSTIYIEADSLATAQPAVTDTYGRNAVWSDYEAVLHLNNTSYTDSTGNGHDGTLTGTTGGAVTTSHPWGGEWIDFTQAGYLTLATSTNLIDATAFTMQYIANFDALSTEHGVLGNWTQNTLQDMAQMLSSGRSFSWDTSGEGLTLTPSTRSTGINYFAHLTQDASFAKVYDNGSFLLSSAGNNTDLACPYDFAIGGYYSLVSAARRANGRIGETRIRRSALSDDWITTEYNNQSSVGAWGTVGAWAESAGGVTGTASHQASTATQSATGERVVTGSSSHSASAATNTSTGVVSGQITGTANHQAITATHTATGYRIVAGSSSHQASNATNSAIGERVVSGSGSHSANTSTHVAFGDRSITCIANHQANDAAHIATGTRTITGSSDHQASTATNSASGTVGGIIAGSANHQASTSTHSATGERVISGASSHQANASTHTATAERIVTGLASHTANTSTHSAYGAVGNVVSGTSSHAANDATHIATGLRIVGGTATNQASNATHSASGTAQGTITGTASHQAARATHNAIGLRLISGTASHQAQTATQAASDIPLVQIPLGLRQTSDITPVRGILNKTPSYGILKLG